MSSFVIFQVAKPGRPMIYSSAVGSMDFRSGNFLAGTPEMGIQSAALTTMGRFYGLPTTAAGCASDAHDIGPEACIEKLLTTLPPVSAGADVIIGYGEIDGAQTLVLEQILVDNELAHLVLRLVGGVDGREDAEFYEPALIGRSPYAAWHALGRPTMYDRARAKVTEILAAPMVDPVPESIVAELDRILAETDRALGE